MSYQCFPLRHSIYSSQSRWSTQLQATASSAHPHSLERRENITDLKKNTMENKKEKPQWARKCEELVKGRCELVRVRCEEVADHKRNVTLSRTQEGGHESGSQPRMHRTWRWRILEQEGAEGDYFRERRRDSRVLRDTKHSDWALVWMQPGRALPAACPGGKSSIRVEDWLPRASSGHPCCPAPWLFPIPTQLHEQKQQAIYSTWISTVSRYIKPRMSKH